MKKLILTILILFLALPCFAGNLLQQEYETKMAAELAKDPATANYTKEKLLENDYQGYLNGGRSLYGYILNLKKSAKNTQNSTDLKYANLMQRHYDIRIKTNNSQLFNLQKITVEDKDYKKLSEVAKTCLYFYNLMAY